MNDIEKYLAKEMNAEERVRFEEDMKRNPELEVEVDYLRQLAEDIETAVVSERVYEAIHSLPRTNRSFQRRPWWWFWLLVSLIALGFIWLQQKEDDQPATSPSSNKITKTETDTTPPVQDAKQKVPVVPSQDYAPSPPLAEVRPTTPKDGGLVPRLRGTRSQDKASRQALMDALWYTEYPPQDMSLEPDFLQVDLLLRQRDFSKSYARLQLLERRITASDELFFLKGYCLLEKREGMEALRYFNKIEDEAPFGSDLLEWYRGLSFLLIQEDIDAQKVFETILKNPNHTFRPQAQKALEMIK